MIHMVLREEEREREGERKEERGRRREGGGEREEERGRRRREGEGEKHMQVTSSHVKVTHWYEYYPARSWRTR